MIMKYVALIIAMIVSTSYAVDQFGFGFAEESLFITEEQMEDVKGSVVEFEVNLPEEQLIEEAKKNYKLTKKYTEYGKKVNLLLNNQHGNNRYYVFMSVECGWNSGDKNKIKVKHNFPLYFGITGDSILWSMAEKNIKTGEVTKLVHPTIKKISKHLSDLVEEQIDNAIGVLEMDMVGRAIKAEN